MTEILIKRPVLWVIRGTSDPILRGVFSNDSEISALSFYYATSATAEDSTWTSLGDTAKPGSVTNPFLEYTHSSAGFTTTYYYRARQKTASSTGPWSNVVRSNVETFLFQLRDAWGLLRGIQLEQDTANSTSHLTWFEAMELMLAVHNGLLDYLARFFSGDDILEIWANPPADLVLWAQSEVSLRILKRADLSPEKRAERIQLAKEEVQVSKANFNRDGIITLANGETKEFNPAGLSFA